MSTSSGVEVSRVYPTFINHQRPSVKHENYSRAWLKYSIYIWYSIPLVMVAGPTFAAYLLLFKIFNTFITYTVTAGVFLYFFRKVVLFFKSSLDREVGYEFKHPFVTTLPYYKDKSLLSAMWAISPLRLGVLTCAIKDGQLRSSDSTVSAVVNVLKSVPSSGPTSQVTKVDAEKVKALGTFGEWDQEPGHFIVGQPIEGYCGHAALNTMLLSVPQARLLAFPSTPAPCSLANITKFFAVDRPDSSERPYTSAHAIHCDPALFSYAQFKQVIRRANSPNVRILVNFLRASLFFKRETNPLKRAFQLMGGHWSVVGSVLDQPEVALILDVNDNYGPYIVPLERLYEACATKDGTAYRGMVVFEFPPV